MSRKQKLDKFDKYIIAKFAGTCRFCYEDYPEGEKIVPWEGSWAHLSCIKPIRPPAFAPRAEDEGDLFKSDDKFWN